MGASCRGEAKKGKSKMLSFLRTCFRLGAGTLKGIVVCFSSSPGNAENVQGSQREKVRSR